MIGAFEDLKMIDNNSNIITYKYHIQLLNLFLFFML